MEKKNLNLEKKIYDICFFIYHLLKVDVQFIHAAGELSLQFSYKEMPEILKELRHHTNMNICDFLKNHGETQYFYYTDQVQLNYLGIGMWEKNQYQGAFILGPFLSNLPDDMFLYDIIKRNGKALHCQMELRQYYTMIPIWNMNLAQKIGSMATNMAMADLKETEVAYHQETSIENHSIEAFWEADDSYSEIEARFFIEERVMEEVRKGDAKGALDVLNSFYFDASHRLPDNPLRVNKDLTFTYNTMLRIAARQGGVNPVYLHRSSDKFAILIEKASNIKELEQLHKQMTEEYCQLVKEVSTNGYSVVIKQVVDYINLNFEKDLSLMKIAENINMNPSHLSKKFKSETGVSMKEFINQRRIKEAGRLLKKGERSITDIAFQVGFEDPSYFSAVFRKFTGQTPKEYRKQYREE